MRYVVVVCVLVSRIQYTHPNVKTDNDNMVWKDHENMQTMETTPQIIFPVPGSERQESKNHQ